jgi:uncharacterized RDD family membrane protein YckC
MTDQERPPEPGGEPNREPEPEQPTVGWTAPTQPGDPPVPPGAVPPGPPTAGVPPPPPIDPPLPAADSGWSEPAPPASPAPPVPAGGEWSQPSSAPGAPGPLISATPSATPGAGWTSQPTSGQREVAPGLVFSSTVSRLAAYIVDGLLLAIVAGIVTSPLNPPQPITSSGQINVTTGTLAGTLISLAINAAYFIAFWSGGRRATLGQMLFKIQVGNAFDGKPLSTNQAVKRWLGLGQFLNVFAFSTATVAAAGTLSAIWSLILLITTATSPTKQGLHDRFANTALVRPSTAGDGLAWTCLILVLILPIVIAVIAIVALIGLGGQVSSILSAVGESV